MKDCNYVIVEDIKSEITTIEKTFKNLFDFFAALVALIVLSPVFLIIYLAVKREDNGSVFFKQERIGYNGRPFTLYKFRSMKENAESNGVPQLYKDGDERLTKVGKFVREHHLDELPQLINVLKGDMSFVGPRPERKFYIDQIMERNSDYRLLFQLRPGLFSYATLYNGYTDTMEKMLKRLHYDLEYLYTRSVYTDIKIIVLTAYFIISGKKF